MSLGCVLPARTMTSCIPAPFSPPVLFHHLSLVEQNYDIGNRELLAVKGLEEWRHWLEGLKIQCLVWTGHKNLAYIQTAKRLNARQYSWSLFFTRFQFTLSYRPGSHNTMPDALFLAFLRGQGFMRGFCPHLAMSLHRGSKRQPLTSQGPVHVQPVGSTSRRCYGPKSFKGHMIPAWPVIPWQCALSISSPNGSGGPR